MTGLIYARCPSRTQYNTVLDCSLLFFDAVQLPQNRGLLIGYSPESPESGLGRSTLHNLTVGVPQLLSGINLDRQRLSIELDQKFAASRM